VTFARDAILSIAAHIAATSTPPPESAAASNATGGTTVGSISLGCNGFVAICATGLFGPEASDP